ncbi:hypothetical protein GQ607_013909 [Colletotrichum asianum]|uniref:Uncharacterized protein n=1 Tax=Colletotrichum asianum TaxID=702518 RepID=A0A8H3W3T9_9PEZI|nr:hypothetical protein GQ607_013909 [Colletotrichum asianum]
MADRRDWAHSASASKSPENLRETSRPQATATAGIEASQLQRALIFLRYQRAVGIRNNSKSHTSDGLFEKFSPLNSTARKEASIDHLAGTKSTEEIHKDNDKQNANGLQKATRFPYSGQLAEDAVDVSTPWDAHGTPARLKMAIR